MPNTTPAPIGADGVRARAAPALAVVAADNENHAYEVARRNASSILSDDGNPYIDVLCEAKTLQDLDHGWNGDCFRKDCKKVKGVKNYENPRQTIIQ